MWKYIYSLREIDKGLGEKSFDSVTKQGIQNLVSDEVAAYAIPTHHPDAEYVKN